MRKTDVLVASGCPGNMKILLDPCFIFFPSTQQQEFLQLVGSILEGLSWR